MIDDFIGSLGHLAMGSRLKRVGMAMQSQSFEWQKTVGCELSGPALTLLAALDVESGITIGRLAEMMGIAQPGVTRLINEMEEGGWVTTETGEQDKRSRIIYLADKGEALIKEAHAFYWPVMRAAVADVCGDLDGPLLDQVEALEISLVDGQFRAALNRHAEKVRAKL